MRERAIVVPLDGSVLAEGALPFAEALAQAGKVGIVLVRALDADNDPPPGAVATARQYVATLADRLQERGIPAEVSVPYGHAANVIVEEARLRESSLIVMATHGRGGLGRLVYGSIAARVLQQAPGPVLLVRAWDPTAALALGGARPRLLVPLDGSALAETALPVATHWATALGGALVLLRAVPIPTAGLAADVLLPSDISQELAEMRAEATDYLVRIAARLEAEGIAVTCDVRVGRAADAIVTVGRELGIALIVMTTHGRTGVARAVFGSVADAIVQANALPLLLVRPAVALSAAQPTSSTSPSATVDLPLRLVLNADEVALLRTALQTLEQALATETSNEAQRADIRGRIAALLARLTGAP